MIRVYISWNVDLCLGLVFEGHIQSSFYVNSTEWPPWGQVEVEQGDMHKCSSILAFRVNKMRGEVLQSVTNMF